MISGATINDQVRASELTERIAQLERIAHEISDTAVRMRDVADRIFGGQPMCQENGKAPFGAFSLLSRFDEALQSADRNLGELRANIARVEVI